MLMTSLNAMLNMLDGHIHLIVEDFSSHSSIYREVRNVLCKLYIKDAPFFLKCCNLANRVDGRTRLEAERDES